ncbi:MAG: hypothetical protein EOO25_02170 [Comamonadaceae bacterium]|nr:MAG: hypothetical protein EOO25_02170 [Comamonadaceae bacterium]
MPSFPCGGSPPQLIYLKPVPKLTNPEFTNQGADCAMWQTFFYLNWPALPGKRGIPNTAARFGAPGPTVWETFKTEEQVFLPNGAKPGPWDIGFTNSALPAAVSSQVGAGQVRLLTRTSKVSAGVARLVASQPPRNTPIPLDQIKQADGNVLYDQQKLPVYYDVAMNRTQFDYILGKGLYNADTQAAYASKTNIVLPLNSIEVKAAWKVLTSAETASGRFHTSTGYLPAPSTGGQGQTVTVGMVGFHVFASGGPQTAGLWATFYQIDNAPLAGVTPTGTATYSFFKAGSSTPVNTTGTNPTQVVQNFPDDPVAANVNQQARKVIIEGDAKSPWQYYAMVDTQWSRSVLKLTTPVPATVPLNAGTVSTATLVNPVLETYMQTANNSCLGCHSFATTAKPNSNTASGFSFMFGNAQSPKKP